MVVAAVRSSVVVAVAVAAVRAKCRAIESLRVVGTRAVVVAACRHGRRARTNGELGITAEHSNPRTILRTAERNHVTSDQDVSADTMSRRSVVLTGPQRRRSP